MTLKLVTSEDVMARADRSGPKRQFQISVHALDQFRVRADKQYAWMNDAQLGDVLDQKMRAPVHTFSVTDPRAPTQVTTLYEIETASFNMFVVVRDQTAITLLDRQMAETNFGGSFYMNKPFTRESLKTVMTIVQNQPAPLSPRDKAILAGAEVPQPPTLPTQVGALSPVELAGLAYARAEQHLKESQRALARAKEAVLRAEEDLQAAQCDRNDKHAAMLAAVTGDDT